MKKLILLVFASVSLLFSCDNNDSLQESETTPNVQLATDATFGSFLTDADGMSLYFFSKDTKEASVCVDGCLGAWPLFYAEDFTYDEGLEASDFEVITRADGEKQTTYKGWPLYYFASDNAVGDTKGDKVGNNWYLAKPDYTLMYAQAQLLGKDGENYKSDYTLGDGLTFYMTSATGRTIYLFKNDTKDDNNFTNEDHSNDSAWPIYYKEIDKLPSILDKNDFGVIEVFGKKQTTYKGWPLYYYGADVERGDNLGISVPAPGVWPIANTDTSSAQ